MNWDRIAGKLRQFKGIAMQQCGRLTGDRLYAIAGRCEELAGQIQEARGEFRDAARKRPSVLVRGWKRD